MVLSTAQQIHSLLEKTSDWDKDERYMATSDLCTELQKDVKIEPQLERRVCAAVLKQLDDSSNDVQGIAVKCLGILLKKVQEAQVGEICDKLCTLILEGKPELRDIYSIGLKTLISDVPDAMGPSVAKRLTARLLGGVQKEEAKLECLDNLTDLMRRFGHEVEPEHNRVIEALLVQLGQERAVVRKRATACLGSIAVVLSDALLNKLVVHLLAQIKGSDRADIVRTLIQAIGTISRTVGFRLGRHLDAIVPLFLKFIGDMDDEDMHTEAASELRDNCFQGFESFVLRCPREVTPHLDKILDVVLRFARYDPNYSYDSDDVDADVGGGQQEEEEDFMEDDFGGGSDDDDTSWKVRRSALRVVRAIVTTRTERLEWLCGSCCDVLVSRFKEREENVRVDVFGCFTSLLEAAGAQDARQRQASAANAAMMDATDDVGETAAVALLRAKLPQILRAAQRQIKVGSGSSWGPKTTAAAWQMLRALCRTLRGGLSGPHMGPLVGAALLCLKDKHQGLKLEALLFLRLALETHPAAAMHPYLPQLVPAVTACVSEEGYKVIAEALRVVSALVVCMCPEDAAAAPSVDWRPYVMPLYEAVLSRLSAHDIDQEIKECAIGAMGVLLAHMGPALGPQLPAVLALLMDRLRNEITRVATLRALAQISSSPVRVDLGPVLTDATQELALLLRQQSRPLKQAALEALLALLHGNAARMDGALLARVVAEAAPLVSDADLHLAHLALQVVSAVLAASPTEAPAAIKDSAMPSALALAASPLLQGPALASLLDLLRALVVVDAAGLRFNDLLTMLHGTAKGGGGAAPAPRQAIGNLAQCVAAVCAAAKESERAATVAGLLRDARGADEARRHLSLLALAELATLADLSAVANLKELLLGTFDDAACSEEARTAAAYALGRLAVGSRDIYLPVVLDALESTRHQYLLLSSLKEVIVCHARARPPLDFSAALDQVLPHLFGHCQSPEEGVRNMVAACLGALATMHPDRVVPALLEALANAGGEESSDALARWTVATALKHCMAGDAPIAALSPHMRAFLALLNDPDLDVRRGALLLANAAIHHQPALVEDLLAEVITPVLLETVELKMERVVDLGPFKHRVDDAEPLRKAALACIDTILDVMPERLDEVALMPHLAKGLADSKPDVQTLCHQILAKLCDLRPGAVLNSMDTLITPLEKAVNKPTKENQVGTEVERANDLVRSALRCVAAMSRLEEIEQISRSFVEFRERLLKKEKLAALYESVTSERIAVEA